MCGIAGIHLKEAYVGRFPLDRMADALLLGIESRGRDATGYVAVNDKSQIRFQKAPVRARDFIEKKKEIPADARTVLLHTRFATKGEPTNPDNNHPVVYGTCFTVHNGHINNDDEIFNTLDIARIAEVDSEAISAALSYHGFASNEDIKEALEQLQGGFAIAAIDPDACPGRLLLAKGQSSPLIVLNHKKAIIWASTRKAIEDAWGAVMGTPPKKKATLFRGEYEGFADFWPGKAFVIDGDNVELLDFTAAYRRYTGSSNYRSASDTTEDDWYYPYTDCAIPAGERWMDEDADPTRDGDTEVIGWNRQPGWQKDESGGWAYKPDGSTRESMFPEMPVWTCTPSYKNCEHPCTEGCNSFVKCVCIEGHPDHPRPGTAIVRWGSGREEVRIDRMTGEVIEGTVARLYQCDGCDEFYRREEMGTLILGSDNFDLCRLCWEAETEEPFPVVGSQDVDTLDDSERKLRNQIHQRAIAETAWELNCSTEYVVWLLFKCPDATIQSDESLRSYYETAANEYKCAKAIAHDLLTGVYEGG